MEIKKKELYLSPEVHIFEVKSEGVICASEVRGGNSINNWENGDTTEDVIYM